MQRSLIFWVMMLLWLLSIAGVFWGPKDYHLAFVGGSTFFNFVLFGLLGWQVYGPAIKG